jgi:nitroimidazol reductase NimA-like FMN-containing flavoprotein (pyridoxamine 5'-phosphate oxidase superfamily)
VTIRPEIPTELGDSFAPGACWRLLATAKIGRLAVLVRREPLVFPVSHVVDDGTIAFRIHASDMLAGVTAHPRVAFEVDEIDTATGEGWSVLAKGDADVSYEPPAESDGTTRRYSTWLVNIRPTEVTGRRVVLPTMATADDDGRG